LIANNIKSAQISESIAVKTVSPEDITIELTPYQYGFILRDEHIMNQVSCPIKLCEYLANGVIPIMSQGIGDFATQAKSLGYIFNGNPNELGSLICEGVDAVHKMSLDGINYAEEHFLIGVEGKSTWYT